MKPLYVYFTGTGAWYTSWGIQNVAFAWLVTIVLNESPSLVGVAQMALMTPAMLFMLVGGSLADHYGGRKVVIFGHIVAALAPMFLTIVVLLDQLSYPTIIVFAVIMGTAQALVTPARDGLLPLVADGRIQRRVVQTSMIQFGLQMLGFLAASFADEMGAAIILSLQTLLLLLGAVAFSQLKVPQPPPAIIKVHLARHLIESISIGYRTVKASPSMATVVIQNCAMGLFFMGSYIVTLPLLVRELYQGGSVELSWMNAGNSLGLVLTILVLLNIGDIKRQGRALIISHMVACFALASGAAGFGFWTLVVSVFLWGTCGGIAMTMCRTIMQEQSPPDQRARMMAFFSFSFMGAGPLGALFSGIMVEFFGAQIALVTSSALMFIMIVLVGLRSSLWQLESRPLHATV